jgi:hypoxanthine-guanine phosphoribosyltransferase
MPTIPGGILFSGYFKDESGYPLTFDYMNAASYGVNRVQAYHNNVITVLPNTNHIM